MDWDHTALLWVIHSVLGSPDQDLGGSPRVSYLIEVSHILAVLQHPRVEGLPWVGTEDKKLGSDLSAWQSPGRH